MKIPVMWVNPYLIPICQVLTLLNIDLHSIGLIHYGHIIAVYKRKTNGNRYYSIVDEYGKIVDIPVNLTFF